MSEFALKTQLPPYLREWQLRIEEFARGYGLDFFPVIFEILTYDQMNEIAAYGGFPNRYPHWRFGMEYEQLSKSYEYGLSKIYEMVINSNPSYAYLLEGNSLTDQKLVMAHVLAHIDFFKNNFAFRATDLDASGRVDPVRRIEGYDPNRKWIDKMANHGQRIRRAIERHGIVKIEELIDNCLSLENLIDPHLPFAGRRAEEPEEDDRAIEVPRLRSKDYMDPFINPEEFIEAQKKRLEEERDRQKRFPEKPERDVLLFLLAHAPLERWERDVLEVLRTEAYYFVPQMQTKIMNEGWACLRGDMPVFTSAGMLTMAELVRGGAASVSDGEVERRVYDRHVIRDHETITVKTRRGLSLVGSNNHRIVAADGSWKRLDELAPSDRVRISGGADLWPRDRVRLEWTPPVHVTLADVAETAGVSISTVVRHRGGAHGRSAEAVSRALEPYERPESQRLPIGLARRKAVFLPTVVCEGLGAFLGLLVGDGHVSRVKRCLGITSADEENVLAFLSLARELFGLGISLRLDGERWRALLHSDTVADLLIDGLGLTHGPSAREKRIPDVILRSPEPVVRAFLRAYFDCDGHAGPQGVILSTMSERMSEQVQLILLNYRILSRRRRQRDGCWHVHVTGSSASTFAERVGFGLARKQRALDEYVRERRWFKEERWEDEVVAVERGRADVYDISVETTHRYAAAGFVNHNSYWHSKLMTERILDASEIIDYADRNAGVLATSGGRLNPYKLGVELFRHVEERWNRGQFGREWEECDSLETKKDWDMRLGLGRKKIFEVRALYNDVTFIDEFLTPEFCREHKLFSFGWSNRNERYEIESREFKAIKDKLLFQLTNAGQPFIYIEDANFENRGELLLRHEHQGVDLRADYARETLKALVRLWKRPVSIATIFEGKGTMLRFDGREHTSRVFKP